MGHRLSQMILCLGLVLSVTVLVEAQSSRKTSLFGSREIRSDNMASFDKWTGVWRRHNLQRAERENNPNTAVPTNGPECRGRDRIRCGREAWNKFITEQQQIVNAAGNGENADGQHTPVTRELIDAVNLYMNRSAYIVDPVNWGIPDHWATPDEFFLKDGDCEDYAISKYVTLKRLGVDPSLMRLVVLQDENLGVAHAVLAVQFEGTFFILDNQVDSILPHDQILHYRPVYSINESFWWLHQMRRFSRR